MKARVRSVAGDIGLAAGVGRLEAAGTLIVRCGGVR
jgi:hypothetical protein